MYKIPIWRPYEKTKLVMQDERRNVELKTRLRHLVEGIRYNDKLPQIPFF
ncbi:unnamed protein product [Acanthoscelides obtectus]|uniref:Uncharacterized protein n=1 Tax=Acanthoscelides obtectus TaxID=200917 RepID=A0A9P0L8Q6_ACAOB|nr:unnamed protein product [Acanthoscelides obtectus]CAK1630909.1 hypothetical protein AOBTE_LOCUS6633 [Acanthoscelides obtectus]